MFLSFLDNIGLLVTVKFVRAKFILWCSRYVGAPFYPLQAFYRSRKLREDLFNRILRMCQKLLSVVHTDIMGLQSGLFI
jgi:hypothetical protein